MSRLGQFARRLWFPALVLFVAVNSSLISYALVLGPEGNGSIRAKRYASQMIMEYRRKHDELSHRRHIQSSAEQLRSILDETGLGFFESLDDEIVQQGISELGHSPATLGATEEFEFYRTRAATITFSGDWQHIVSSLDDISASSPLASIDTIQIESRHLGNTLSVELTLEAVESVE